jgi:hypothetical protein
LKPPKGTDENRVALIQIGDSHDEFLYDQFFGLKNTIRKILLVCTENLRVRNPYFEKYTPEYYTAAFFL